MPTDPSLNAAAFASGILQEPTELQVRPGAVTHYDGQHGHDRLPSIQRRSGPASAQNQPGTDAKLWHNLKKFWSRQITLTVSHDDCRDHFGMYFSIFSLR